MSPSEGEAQDRSPPRPAEGLERQLEAAEERLLVVVGLTGGLVLEFDAEGRFLEIWTRSNELLAIPREQALGRTLAEVFGPQAAAPFMERITRILATGESDRFEYSLDVPGGMRWFSADGVLLPQRQSVAFLVRDITRYKEMEQRLLLTDRLSALGTLAAGMAHEVNNPLSYVSANLNFALEELSELLRALKRGAVEPARLENGVEEALEALRVARDGTTRIHHIVGNLTTFARGGASTNSRADVKRSLEASLAMVAKEVRAKAQLSHQLQEVPQVHGSEARLGQVFLNLLINASQAIPPGAPERHRVEVRLRAEGQWVVVEIEDTGAGIPADLLKRIFDPFFTTKPTGMGTGLGLSICHGIVTEVGGEISVESTVGQGSCFRVRLPVDERDAV